MTPVTTLTRKSNRLPALQAAEHQFKLGQAVRLRGGLLPNSNIYLITAMLPTNGDSPQYRIRNETENFERMATQVTLEPVSASTGPQNSDPVGKSPAIDQVRMNDNREVEAPKQGGLSAEDRKSSK